MTNDDVMDEATRGQKEADLARIHRSCDEEVVQTMSELTIVGDSNGGVWKGPAAVLSRSRSEKKERMEEDFYCPGWIHT